MSQVAPALAELLKRIPQGTTIALAAGEVSGDQLGAGLVAQLKALRPDLKFVGIGGDLMRAQGVETWFDMSALSYFGIVDVVLSLPKILSTISRTKKLLKESGAQLYIGIDNPDFNLRIETYAKQQLGIKTIQYVSPSVWAWRQGRIETIKQACDLVLCLLPFEKAFYDKKEQKAIFVGHRLANKLAPKLQKDVNVISQVFSTYAEQLLYRITEGKVSISQAKRLLTQHQSEKELLSDSDYVAKQQARELAKGGKNPDLLSGIITEHDHPYWTLQQPSTLDARVQDAAQATFNYQHTNLVTNDHDHYDHRDAHKDSKQPKGPSVKLGYQTIQLKKEDLTLGVDGNYYATFTPEQVEQAFSMSGYKGRLLKAAVDAEKATYLPTKHKKAPTVFPDFIAQAERLQDFVGLLPSAQEATYTLEGKLESVHHLPVEQVNMDESTEAQNKQITTEIPIRIAILPGSRSSEIENILSWYLAGVQAAVEKEILPANVELVIPVAKEKLKEEIIEICQDYPRLNIKLVDKHVHDVLATSIFALVSSGTATLDAMLVHTPMIVGYRLSTFNFFLAKRLIRTPFIALANVVMGRELAKELIQDDLNSDNLVTQIKALLQVNYNLAVRNVYFFEHLKLQRDSDNLAAQAVLELLASKYPQAEIITPENEKAAANKE